MKILFYAKQCVKMMLQSFILPVIYRMHRHKPVNKKLVIFADCHNNDMPFSMRHMYETVKSQGFETQVFCNDFKTTSYGKIIKAMFKFMKAYAQAGTVFICDYYLPAASCRRRKETEVVQLWHACGAFKKFGYDTGEDIPDFYKGNPLRNCTLVTVSSKFCESVYARAMHLPKNIVKATGTSRTDLYFDQAYLDACRKRFFDMYPKARGRKILLWAPTFRGNAGDPKSVGLEDVEALQEKLGNDWYVIIKLHPHLEKKFKKSNCTLLTEELLPVADILMTDYSSVLFDFMLMKKPVVLFAPDNKEYLRHRGFYLDYQSIPAVHVRSARELPYAVKSALTDNVNSEEFCRQYVGNCDGHATERILKELYD